MNPKVQEPSIQTSRTGDLLLVEDNPFDAHQILAWLDRSETTWNVTHCMSLDQALKSLKGEKPDLIISDLSLPDSPGLQAIKALVEAAPEVPLIVLEGSVRLDLADAVLEVGAQDYINGDEISEGTLHRAMKFAMTRHSAHRRLASLQGSLAEADDELEEYASMLAHDLRAPLRTSRLLAQTLVKFNPDGMGHELATRLDSTLGSLDSVLLSMLDYSNLRECEPEIEPVDISALINEVLAGLEADLDSADATLSLSVDPKLTVAATPAAVWRILENLLCNALKYRSDERPLEIKIESTRSEQTCRITVHDNGIGIPKSERERVMRPLERIDSRIDGSGFGLAICRRQLSKLDGQIWVADSDRASGTSITFELPVVG